jgi:hypothetical protein
MSQAATNSPLIPGGTVPVGSSAGSTPAVSLTIEQSQAKLLELRDAEGNVVGLLFRDGGMAKFYTPTELAELDRRALSRERGRTLREVLDAVQQRGEASRRTKV